MKLYSMAGTCAVATHVALEWSGLPHETRIMARGQQNEIEYLSKNPLGVVPALEFETGEVLTEALAILLYIDATAQDEFGMTAQPFDLAKLARLLSFLTSEVHVGFGPHFVPHRYHRDKSEHPELRSSAYVRLRRLVELLDQHFAGPYFFGKSRSVADPYIFVITRWIASTPLELSSFPALSRFSGHMHEDQEVARVLSQYA